MVIVTILLGVLLALANKLWDPIAQHVGYPFEVRRRVKDLQNAVQRLLSIQADLHRLDPQPSSEQGKGWVQSVRDLQLMAEKIKTGYDGCGLNYLSNCYFGRQADEELKKAIDLIVTGKELLKEAKERPHPVPHVLLQHPQDDQLWGMASYKKKVQDFIQDKSTRSRLLGIWGMGGVGKTSLLKLFRDSSARYPDPFDHVLFISAGREGTVGSMQKAIAARMGLPVMPDETSQEGIIYNHLKDRSFLLLIDDLWKYHDLAAVGIPMPLGTVLALPNGGKVQEYWRKVVFTTRSMDVCRKMRCGENTIRLECLSEDDAWNLFVDKVGNNEIINDTQLHKLAKKVVLECSGLPLALCTIGQAMSTKKRPSEWRYAIDLLKKSKLLEITNTDEALFERLKLSFDNMVKDDLKKCFLICSLWAKDENIPKEKLIEWWVGLGFLDDASNPTDAGYSIINNLMNASMLENGDISLDSTENSHVKMHKVICQMALWIANGHGRQDIWLPHSFRSSPFPEEKWHKVERAWIFPVDTSRWSSSIRCPELKMLVARQPFSLQFISNFTEITFLDLERMTNKDNNFPLEICALNKLQYLNLSASNIDGLPIELSQLSNLKYLYIRGIEALRTIPKGIISQMKKLLGLDLFCSGAISHKVQYLTSLLEELASDETIHLHHFGVTVHTRADIEQLGRLSSVRTQALCIDQFEYGKDLNKIDLLHLLCGLENMRELTITNSSFNQELVAEGHPDDEYGLLPYLEFLELRNLFKLQEVTWKNAGINLRVVGIYSCTKLRHATWVRHLQSLEELTISDCPELEQVTDNAEANQTGVSFLKLRKLRLEQLPELFSISEQGFPLEELSYVCVAKCEKLKFIKIQQRINQQKIRIDCSRDWWTSSVENQGIVNSLFVPTFCL